MIFSVAKIMIMDKDFRILLKMKVGMNTNFTCNNTSLNGYIPMTNKNATTYKTAYIYFCL
jgi:hypothetical protein